MTSEYKTVLLNTIKCVPIFRNKFKECVEILRENKLMYKDLKKCENLRLKGNTKYEKKDLFEAIKLYSESIAYGPFNTDALAKSYGNRSAVLVECGFYKECIEDMNKAYEHGYSKTEEKLLLRRALCQYMLYEDTELSNTIQKIILLSKAFNTEDKIMKYLKLKPKNNKLFIGYHPNLPSLSYGASKEIPCASSAIKIAYDNINGQHLIATRDIEIGDILIIEKSFTSYLWKSHLFYYHCTNCTKLSLSLIPCPNCTWAMFCSEKCYNEANEEYHTLECECVSKYIHVYETLNLDEISYHDVDNIAVIRALCKAGLDNLQVHIDHMNNKKKRKKSRTSGFTNGIYDISKFETFFNLPDIIKSVIPAYRDRFVLEAVIIARCLNLNQYEFHDLSALCFKIILNMARNSTFYLNRYLQDENLETLSGVVLSVSALATTECYSNTMGTAYDNNIKVTKCSLPIKKGELITRTYISHQPSPFLSSVNDQFEKYQSFFGSACQCRVCKCKINLTDYTRPCIYKPSRIREITQYFVSNVESIMNNGYLEVSDSNEYCRKLQKLYNEQKIFITTHYEKHPFDPIIFRIYHNILHTAALLANCNYFQPC